MGKRKQRDVFVPRPFEGLVDEPEWIALRELVPAATAPLRLHPDVAAQYGDRPVTLATLLPMAMPALTRADGSVLLGLQRQISSGDPNRDLAASVLAALATEPGTPVQVDSQPGPGPRLADVLDDQPLDVTVHDGFEFWLDGDETDPAVRASMERANESAYPSVRMAAAPAAYWCRVAARSHVRWVLPEQEDAALTALARLRAEQALTLGEETKFAGMFRAYGRLVPVWDLPREAPASAWEQPLATLAQRYAEALAAGTTLDAATRKARQGLVGRQLTLR